MPTATDCESVLQTFCYESGEGACCEGGAPGANQKTWVLGLALPTLSRGLLARSFPSLGFG